MPESKEKTQEYFLLRNYKEMTLTTRGILLKSNFDSLEKIQNNSWIVKLNESELDKGKRMMFSMVQSDIVAKIMMYVEDFALISEGLLRDQNYYALLDQKINPVTNTPEDVGKIIESFFNKIDCLPNEELQKILSYGKPEEYSTDDNEIKLLQKSLEKELEEFKRVVKMIDEFGKEHHPYYRRYKHAGFPYNPGMPIIEPLPDYIKKFDFISLVYLNEDIFNEPKIIPYSNKVKESYHIIIHGLQQILQDITDNRMAYIQRGKKLPPIPWRSSPYFTPEEMEMFEKILQRYDKENTASNLEFNINYMIKNTDSWYSHLDEFIEKCSKTRQMDQEFGKKTNYKFYDTRTREKLSSQDDYKSDVKSQK